MDVKLEKIVKLVEALITTSPEFMNKLSEKEKREYFERLQNL